MAKQEFHPPLPEPDPALGEDSRQAMLRMLNAFWPFVARGVARTSDGNSLWMVPEAGGISRTEFFEMKKQGKIETTWRACGSCRAFVQIQHTPEYDINKLPSCPCCDSQSWEETEGFMEGLTDGHLSAPRLP